MDPCCAPGQSNPRNQAGAPPTQQTQAALAQAGSRPPHTLRASLGAVRRTPPHSPRLQQRHVLPRRNRGVLRGKVFFSSLLSP